MLRLLPLILLICLFLVTEAHATGRIAVLYLFNGDRVTGRVLDESKTNIVLQTDWVPRMDVPNHLIRSREILLPPDIPGLPKPTVKPSPAPTPKVAAPAAKAPVAAVAKVDPKPAPKDSPKPTAPAKPAVAAKSKPKPKPAAKTVAKKPKPSSKTAAKKSTAKAPVLAKAKAKPKVKGVWSHDLRLGTDLQYSAVERKIYHTRLRSSYSRGSFRNLIDFSYSYGKSDGVVSADRLVATMKSNYTPRDRWYAYHQGSTGYDIIRRIEFRYQVGPGAGYHLVKGKPFLFDKSKLSLNLETGGEFEDKRATSGISNQKYFWRIAENGTWTINDSLTLSEELEFFPQIGELVSHRYRFEANAAYKLLKNMTLNLTFLAEADPESLKDFEPESVQIRSSLGLKF